MASDKMEKAFVFAAKNGNPKSFEELYKLHCQEIYAIALTITRRKNEAEEVLRATFAAAWQEIETFALSEDFGLWLRDIARRKCDELIAEKQKAQQVSGEEPLTDAAIQDMVIPTAVAMDIFQQVFRHGAESVTVKTIPFPEIPVTPAPETPVPPVPETPAAPVAESVSAPPTQQPVPTGGSTAVSSASSAVKSGFPLWTKITAVVLGASLVAGGGIAAYHTFAKLSDPIVSAAVGDEINFGTYEQDNNPENGAENITWRVLDRVDDKLFVVSKFVLDSAVCEDVHSSAIWGETTMSSKLNNTFFQTAFSEKEQNAVCSTYMLCEDSWVQKKDDAVSVEKVFLLSQYETSQYFSSDDDRLALATEYAAASGARTDGQNRAVWWTRSVVFENNQGAVYENGDNSSERGGHSGDRFGVRPAMWIDTKAVAGEGKAREVVQPIGIGGLPKSLKTFLSRFAQHYYNRSFDCEHVTDESNILLGVIGVSECVDYGLYSKELEEANESQNWFHSDETPSPIAAINEMGGGYKVLDAEAVDTILKTIFHCSDDDIQTMRGMQSETRPYGYADGKYYCVTGGHGDMGNRFIEQSGEYKDGVCYYTVKFYNNTDAKATDYELQKKTPDATVFLKTSLLPHEGKPWWSLYYYSREPFDTKTTDDPAASATEPAKTVSEVQSKEEQNNYKQLYIDYLNNIDTTYYSGELYYINDDDTPELLLHTNTGAHAIVYCLCWIDGEAVQHKEIAAGLFTYHERNGEMFLATGGMMSSGWSYYSFYGDSLERTKHGTRVVTGTNPSNYVTHYSINDNEVSEEEYNSLSNGVDTWDKIDYKNWTDKSALTNYIQNY